MIGGQGLAFGRVVQELAQQMDLARERVDAPALRAGLQRRRRHLIRARSTAEPEIDAARIQHLQHAELLGDLQRAVMGEHHPPEPTRIECVSDATRPMRISGQDPAKELLLWCSASQ